jgi:hypothetical protein
LTLVSIEIELYGVGEATDVADLHDWLRRERLLAGLVQRVRRPIEDGQLGGLADILFVALGSGGAGAVLAQSLLTWLRSRRSDISLTVRTKDSVVRLDATNLTSSDVLLALDRLLRERDG